MLPRSQVEEFSQASIIPDKATPVTGCGLVVKRETLLPLFTLLEAADIQSTSAQFRRGALR